MPRLVVLLPPQNEMVIMAPGFCWAFFHIRIAPCLQRTRHPSTLPRTSDRVFSIHFGVLLLESAHTVVYSRKGLPTIGCMTIRFLASLILVTRVIAAVFGLYMPMMGHGMDCPFAPGGTALCGMALIHLQHWQSAFMATLMYLLALCAAMLLFFVRLDLFDIAQSQYERYRLRERMPAQPTLFQELFASGIVHPKIF